MNYPRISARPTRSNERTNDRKNERTNERTNASNSVEKLIQSINQSTNQPTSTSFRPSVRPFVRTPRPTTTTDRRPIATDRPTHRRRPLDRSGPLFVALCRPFVGTDVAPTELPLYCTSIFISRFMTLLISTYYHKYYTIKSYMVVPVPHTSILIKVLHNCSDEWVDGCDSVG